MRRLLAILFVICPFAKGIGQSLADTVRLHEVFVTSARQVTERAFYIKSIDSIVLANTSGTDLSELLQKYSFLYIKSYGAGGLSTASFRGTSASHTQVLWNGFNINSPLWGQTDLSMMPVFFTDEVSLFYGSSSLAKTSGGLGGCISLNNSPDWNAGTQLSLAQTAGSFGYYLSQLKAGFSRNRFVSSTRLFYDRAKNNFRYYDNASGLFDYIRQKNADYHKEGFLQEVYYKISSRQFAGLKVMSVWADRNLPPIMSFSGASRYENQKDNMLNIIGEWKYYSANSNLTFHSGLIRNSLSYILTNTNPGGTFVNYDTENRSNVFANKLNFQHNFTPNSVLKTFVEANFTSARYSDLKENTGFDVQQSDINLQSSFHRIFNPAVSGYLLAQQKMLDGKLMPFIAAAGLEIQPWINQGLTIRANMGRNLHVPNLNDRYFNPGGNHDLKPETGYQADAGVQFVKTLNNVRFQLEVTGFTAWINDWILWHPSEYRYWTADNVQQVFSRGAEVNAGLKGDLGSVTWQLKGNYAFTRTTNEESESPSKGMQLIYIPKNVSNLQLFLEKGTYSSSISFHNTGSRYTSTTESEAYQLPSYFLLDFALGKKFDIKQHALNFNLKLNNILNKQYQVIEQRAMPGRNFLVGLSFNFSKNGNQ